MTVLTVDYNRCEKSGGDPASSEVLSVADRSTTAKSAKDEPRAATIRPAKRLKVAQSDIQEAKRRAAKQNVYHVIPNDGAWVVKRAGTQRASRVFQTRDEALAFVGVKSSSTPRLKDVGEVVVHNGNGEVETRMQAIRDSRAPLKE